MHLHYTRSPVLDIWLPYIQLSKLIISLKAMATRYKGFKTKSEKKSSTLSF